MVLFGLGLVFSTFITYYFLDFILRFFLSLFVVYIILLMTMVFCFVARPLVGHNFSEFRNKVSDAADRFKVWIKRKKKITIITA